MKIIDLTVNELNQRNIAGFGFALDSDTAKPDAEEIDFRFYYNLIEADFKGPVAISIVESKLQEELYGNSLETHVLTPEVLIPLDGTIYLVLTKSESEGMEKPDLNTAKAFVVKAGQGVLLPPGIWHRAPLSKDKPVKTCCLVRKGTPEDNITFYLENSFDLRYRIVL